MSRLIAQCNFDLHHGPINDGAVGDPAATDEELKKYPGFTTAIKLISQALADLPFDLYLNIETEEVLEIEPEWDKCEHCDGEGETFTDDSEHYLECEECHGQCGFEPAGDWWHVERDELRKVVVGKELSEYI